LSDPSIYRTSPATNLFVAVHCTFAPKKFFAASNTDVTVWSVFGHCKKKVLLGAGFAGAATAAEPSERRSAKPLDASFRPPKRGARAGSRRSPTAVDAPCVARHARSADALAGAPSRAGALFSCIGVSPR
jgi:hypothetical protein